MPHQHWKVRMPSLISTSCPPPPSSRRRDCRHHRHLGASHDRDRRRSQRRITHVSGKGSDPLCPPSSMRSPVQPISHMSNHRVTAPTHPSQASSLPLIILGTSLHNAVSSCPSDLSHASFPPLPPSSRESHSQPMRVRVTDATARLLSSFPEQFHLVRRGQLDIKGKG